MLFSFARWRQFFFKVDLNKLRHNVKNEITLFCAKCGADLINTFKVASRKTAYVNL